MKSWLVPRRVAGGRKAWGGEPPFWVQDAARFPAYNSSTPTRERIENDFEGYVSGGYKSNGMVFACIDRRQQVFSQARFQWKPSLSSEPGDMFGTPELDILETPWPNGTTGELLSRMEIDASLAGQFYATTVDEAGGIGRNATGVGRRISRMRPDWTTLVIDAPSGNPYNVDARVVAYLYQPLMAGGNSEPLILLPSEVCHYSPKPDPTARFRGMSWLTPVIREVMADKAATAHKLKFFENGAQPGLVVKGIRAASNEDFDKIVDLLEEKHRGSSNAFKTLYLTEGADAEALGADMKQVDFSATQGAGETRLSVASGVPAAILGISEGLSGSSLNAGNFQAARRLFVDTTIQDLWLKAAPSLRPLVKAPRSGVVLAVDGRGIPFLREDARDDAAIRESEAQALRTLTDAGFKPDAAIDYIRTGDLNKLVGGHSGLFSVQLQPPGLQAAAMPTLGETNGRANGAQASLAR